MTDQPLTPMAAFLEQIATTFGISENGTVTLELQYVGGVFRWARLHSGPIGRDELDAMQVVTPARRLDAA